MKRKLFGYIKSCFHSLFGDDTRPETPVSNRRRKRRRISVSSLKKESVQEDMVPVLRDGQVVAFQMVPASRPKKNSKDLKKEIKHEGGIPDLEYSSSSEDSITTLEESIEPKPEPVKDDSPKKWDGLPGYSRAHPAIVHNFTWDEYRDMHSQIIIHWAHYNRTRKVGSETSETPEGGKLSYIYCLGVFRCVGCGLEERPKARSLQLRAAQLERACECGSQKVHIECTVVCEIRKWMGGVQLSSFRPHTHDPPARRLHLMPAEAREFKQMVIDNPKATPSQLSAGIPGLLGPGKPASEISPVLHNTARMANLRRDTIYEAVGSGKEESFFKSFHQLKERCPNFVVKQVIAADNDVTVICFQTEFMRSILVPTELIDEAVNGILTDAAHKFFRQALLINSSSYVWNIYEWCSGLFSYSNGATAAHYRIHFMTLFEGIAEEAALKRLKLSDDLFTGVMDFSDAQRLGFIDAFVDFWKSVETDQRDEETLRAAAQACLRGCEFHWEKSVTRVSRIGNVIPADRAREFRKRTDALFDAETDDEFQQIVKILLKKFPKVKSWLEWWLRSSHAAMLFPSQRTMDPNIWDSIPSTTNAEESIHQRLYLAHGKKHTLFEGAYHLYGYGNDMKWKSDAENAGIPTKYGAKEPHKDRAEKFGRTKRPKQPSNSGQVAEEADDRGRAPDTQKELAPKSQNRVSTRRMRNKIQFEEKLKQSELKQTKLSSFVQKGPTNSNSKNTKGTKEKNPFQRQKKQISSDNTSSDTSEPEWIPGNSVSPPESKISIETLDNVVGIPCYTNSKSSCWLDSSLVLLYVAVTRDWDDFSWWFPTTPPNNRLSTIFSILQGRREVISLERGGETIKLLNAQRDVFRKELDKQGALLKVRGDGKHAKMVTMLHQPIWTWLSDMIAKSAKDNNPIYGALAYFAFYTAALHACSGPGDEETRHYELVVPRRHVLHQLRRTDYTTFKGSVENWFQSFISLDRNPVPALNGCWRQGDGKRYCSGSRRDYEDIILSIPVIFVLEVADDLLGTDRWDFPDKLFPSSSRKEIENNVIYDLIGIGFYSSQHKHFCSRFCDEKGNIYAYDDTHDQGHATQIPRATVSTHLAGHSVPLPPSFHTCSAVYRLRGGRSAQQSFFEDRTSRLKAHHNISCSTKDLSEPPELAYIEQGFKQMNAAERTWLFNPFNPRTREYIFSGLRQKEKLKLTMSPDSRHASSQPEGSPPKPSYRMIKPPPSQEQGTVLTPSSVGSGPNEDFQIECRCGEESDGNVVYNGDVVGLAIKCDICQKWMHVACQRRGRADGLTEDDLFECDACDLSHNEWKKKETGWTQVKDDEKEREKLAGLTTFNDLPPLQKRLKAGTGALVHLETFWYPVRLIQKIGKRKKWRVKWWRGCKFEASDIEAFKDIKPGSVTTVSQHDIIDALWLDRNMRREVRLGEWSHPQYGDDRLDLLEDPSSVPYGDEVNQALMPHRKMLFNLLTKPALVDEEQVIPARNYLCTLRKPANGTVKDWVECFGGISVTQRAEIANWFEVHVSKSAKIRAKWMNRLPFAHAITLFLATQIHNHAAANQKLMGQEVLDFLGEAWEVQQRAEKNEVLNPAVDVDAECLAHLEKQMFERSDLAGLAGYYQWGLNSGSHQNGWNPYEGTPEDWQYFDEGIWSDSELEPGPNFVNVAPVAVQSDSEEKPKTQPKPRPINPKKQDVNLPVANAAEGQLTRRTQPKRKARSGN